jgi:hypothetical protein
LVDGIQVPYLQRTKAIDQHSTRDAKQATTPPQEAAKASPKATRCHRRRRGITPQE